MLLDTDLLVLDDVCKLWDAFTSLTSTDPHLLVGLQRASRSLRTLYLSGLPPVAFRATAELSLAVQYSTVQYCTSPSRFSHARNGSQQAAPEGVCAARARRKGEANMSQLRRRGGP